MQNFIFIPFAKFIKIFLMFFNCKNITMLSDQNGSLQDSMVP